MNLDPTQLIISGVSASAVIVGLVWALSAAGLPPRFKPIVADALGLLGGVAAVLLVPPPSGADALATVLLWLGTGVLASGAWSQARTVADV